LKSLFGAKGGIFRGIVNFLKILGFETFFGAKEGIFKGDCKFFENSRF